VAAPNPPLDDLRFLLRALGGCDAPAKLPGAHLPSCPGFTREARGMRLLPVCVSASGLAEFDPGEVAHTSYAKVPPEPLRPQNRPPSFLHQGCCLPHGHNTFS